MNEITCNVLSSYINKYSFIAVIKDSILSAFNLIDKCYKAGGKLLICGNGGSAADADHIVGELLKGFNKSRRLTEEQTNRFKEFGKQGEHLASVLQGALPAINLSAHTSLITAIINDIGAEEIYAQQVIGYGNRGDLLLGISTSGNSKNIINAGIAAKVMGVNTLALTGEKGGIIADSFDIAIKVPSSITCDIQDMHSIVYHLLCTMIEAERWDI